MLCLKSQAFQVMKCQKCGCPSNLNLAPYMCQSLITQPYPSPVPSFIQCSGVCLQNPTSVHCFYPCYLTSGYNMEWIQNYSFLHDPFSSISHNSTQMNCKLQRLYLCYETKCILSPFTVHGRGKKSLSGGYERNQWQNWNWNSGLNPVLVLLDQPTFLWELPSSLFSHRFCTFEHSLCLFTLTEKAQPENRKPNRQKRFYPWRNKNNYLD